MQRHRKKHRQKKKQKRRKKKKTVAKGTFDLEDGVYKEPEQGMQETSPHRY